MERREPFLISVKDVLSAAVGAYRPAVAIASPAGRILRYDYHGSIGHRDEDGQFDIGQGTPATVRYFCIRKPGAAAPPRAQLRISMGLGLTGVHPADCSSHILLNFLPAI